MTYEELQANTFQCATIKRRDTETEASEERLGHGNVSNRLKNRDDVSELLNGTVDGAELDEQKANDAGYLWGANKTMSRGGYCSLFRKETLQGQSERHVHTEPA
jgi:hypothetical protein